jgi:hypothetical protein
MDPLRILNACPERIWNSAAYVQTMLRITTLAILTTRDALDKRLRHIHQVLF